VDALRPGPGLGRAAAALPELSRTTGVRLIAATGGGPELPYQLTTLRPRVAAALGEEAARAVFVTHPARAFAAEWRGPLGS